MNKLEDIKLHTVIQIDKNSGFYELIGGGVANKEGYAACTKIYKKHNEVNYMFTNLDNNLALKKDHSFDLHFETWDYIIARNLKAGKFKITNIKIPMEDL
jgi:hypothetical protein